MSWGRCRGAGCGMTFAGGGGGLRALTLFSCRPLVLGGEHGMDGWVDGSLQSLGELAVGDAGRRVGCGMWFVHCLGPDVEWDVFHDELHDGT